MEGGWLFISVKLFFYSGVWDGDFPFKKKPSEKEEEEFTTKQKGNV